MDYSWIQIHLTQVTSAVTCWTQKVKGFVITLGSQKKLPSLGLPLPASMPALCSIRALGVCGLWLGNRREMTLDNTWELRAEAALKLSFTKEFEGLKHVGSVWLRVFQTEIMLVWTSGCWVGAEPWAWTGANQACAQTEGEESSDWQHRAWRDGMCWPGVLDIPQCNKKAARSARAHMTRAAFLFGTTCRTVKPLKNGEINLNHETCSFESPTGAVLQLFQTINSRSRETNN